MDHRSVKRPRSTTPVKGGAKGDSPPKKKKSTKKTKRSRSNSQVAAPDTSTINEPKTSSLDSTATADGQMMLQMLSTFSSVEQSRFEAFQRASLNQSAVQEWLAACIASTPSMAPLINHHSNNNINTKSSGSSKNVPPLSDLVAPGQANDIGMVVATLAKIYAQRLAAAAAKIAAREQQQQLTENQNDDMIASSRNNPQQQQTSSSSSSVAAASVTIQIQPEHLWQAREERRDMLGLDPGFFFVQQPTLFRRRIVAEDESYNQRRLAALAVQEEYDKAAGDTS